MTDARVQSIRSLFARLCLSGHEAVAFSDTAWAERVASREDLIGKLIEFGVKVYMRRTWLARFGSMFRLAWMSRKSKAMALERNLQAVVDGNRAAALALRQAQRRGPGPDGPVVRQAQQHGRPSGPAALQAQQHGRPNVLSPGRPLVLSDAQQSCIMGVLLYSHGVMEERLPWEQRSCWTQVADGLLWLFRFIHATVLAVALVNPVTNPFFP